MKFSDEMHIFRIDDRFYGGEQPPYLPEFDSGSSFADAEIQSQYDDFQELLKNFHVFIDLREKDEPYYEYGKSLPEGYIYERVPVKDLGAPESPEQIHPLICRINGYLESGKSVYLHCHGGRGRTGTAAGCWMAYSRHLTGREVVEELNRLFADSLKGREGKRCPETEKQERFITDYALWCQQKH